jgi:hypothetical protein
MYIIKNISEKIWCVQPLETTGTLNARLSAYYRGLTGHAVSCPVGADVFKAHGSGMNYVHGGSSP